MPNLSADVTRADSRVAHGEKSAGWRNSLIDSVRGVEVHAALDKASPSQLHRPEVCSGFEREADLTKCTGAERTPGLCHAVVCVA